MFNTMIRGYVESNKPVHAICCFLDLLSNGALVNNFTFTPLVKACSCLELGSREKLGVLAHSHVVKFGFCDDPFVISALIEFYSLAHEMSSARKLFAGSTKGDVVVWTAMAAGAMMAANSRVSNFREVLALFGEMQEVGVKPNESALVSVLTACANVGALTQGCEAWSAVISGVAMNGHARKSLELFYKMVGGGIQPNEITFVAILSACTHAKFVEEGLKLFEKMSTCYEVEPQLEQYACFVDLLARAGKLDEAEKLIDEKMGGIE
ncbi:Pentatricopeptide repeat [Dillenia turbinata]|uniref:Pentatricopeptide repeat n=1 Tax=Dillenia turbinata TaxID=194707 RepID=A0AAN8ZPP2_9MAGN